MDKLKANTQIDISPVDEFYSRAFYLFDQYLNEIYNKSNQNREYEGYLIDLKDLEEIKTKIDYNKNRDKVRKYLNYKKLERRVYTLKGTHFTNSKQLINKINNNNKYILINKELWKTLGGESEIPFKYKIENDILNLQIVNKKLKFYQNKEIKNLIDKDTFEMKNTNTETNTNINTNKDTKTNTNVNINTNINTNTNTNKK